MVSLIYKIFLKNTVAKPVCKSRDQLGGTCCFNSDNSLVPIKAKINKKKSPSLWPRRPSNILNLFIEFRNYLQSFVISETQVQGIIRRRTSFWRVIKGRIKIYVTTFFPNTDFKDLNCAVICTLKCGEQITYLINT